MTAIINIAEMRMRCPRCGAGSIVQSKIKVRGFHYLTLRCVPCAIVFSRRWRLHKAKKDRR